MPIVSATVRLISMFIAAHCMTVGNSFAQAKSPENLKTRVAVVDYNRLAAEYKGLIEKPIGVNAIVAELDCWDQHRYLAEVDQRALSRIAVKEVNKTPFTPQEQATKKHLEAESKALFDEYLALQTIQNPTPANMARLKELSDREQETSKRIKDRQAAAKAELQKQRQDKRAGIEGEIKAAIAEVAKAMGIDTVVGCDSLLFTTVQVEDITEAVLKKLKSRNDQSASVH